MESSAVGEAMLANASRNSLKDLFRIPGFHLLLQGWRQPFFGALYAKYSGDISRIAAGAATTSGTYNSGAVAAIATAATVGGNLPESSGCGCGD